MIDIEKLKLLALAVRDLEDDTEKADEHAEAADALWLHMHCHTLLDLIAEVESLQVTVEDLALSLECEVKARYAGSQSHPAIKRKYDGDMQEVIDARALIALQKLTWNPA